MRGVGWVGWWRPPPGSPLAEGARGYDSLKDRMEGPPLPVTLRFDPGGNDPLTPLHRLSTASLSGVVRCVAIATLIFRYFLRYFSSTSTEQIFPDSAGLFVVSIVFGFAIFA